MAVSVCFVFTVTIGVFPAITAKVSTVLGEGNKWGKCGQGWGGVGGNWEQSKWGRKKVGLEVVGMCGGWTLSGCRVPTEAPP